MTDAKPDMRHKVTALFTELAESRAIRLDASRFAHDADGAITNSLSDEFGLEQAADIAFHLSDWGADAAFIVAVHLFPERFTPDEVREGILAFLIHAPNHIAAAAHLSGWPIKDVFNVGLEISK